MAAHSAGLPAAGGAERPAVGPICSSFSALTSGVVCPVEWASLHFAFAAHRCAVAVSLNVAHPHDVTLTPFVNLSYDNRLALAEAGAAAPPALRMGNHAQDAAAYYEEKAGALGMRVPEHRQAGFKPTQREWWFNGHTLCNVVPPDVWSSRGLAAAHAMLQAGWHALVRSGAAAKLAQGRRVLRLVFNKRDAPLMPKGLALCPFPAFGPRPMHPAWQRPMSPPLSFYVGDAWEDVALPLTEAWEWVHDPAPRAGSAAALVQAAVAGRTSTELRGCVPRAVFRGTATGPHASAEEGNQRLQLALLARHHADVLDAGITAWNARDRVHGGVVSFQRADPRVRVAQPLTPGQQAAFRVIVYVDGHQAASRLVWHLAAGRALVMVAPCDAVQAPRTWLHAHLRPHVHYVPVKADLSDLVPVVTALLRDDAACVRLARAALALAAELLHPAALVQAAGEAMRQALHRSVEVRRHTAL